MYSCIKLNFGSLPGASGSGGGEAADERRMRSLLRAAREVQHAMRAARHKAREQIALCCLPDRRKYAIARDDAITELKKLRRHASHLK